MCASKTSPGQWAEISMSAIGKAPNVRSSPRMAPPKPKQPDLKSAAAAPAPRRAAATVPGPRPLPAPGLKPATATGPTKAPKCAKFATLAVDVPAQLDDHGEADVEEGAVPQKMRALTKIKKYFIETGAKTRFVYPFGGHGMDGEVNTLVISLRSFSRPFRSSPSRYYK